MRIACISAAVVLIAAQSVEASPITIGGFTFSEGEAAFADDAFLVSGTIRFTCATAAAGPAGSVAEALAGSNLEQCVNNNTGNSGVVEAVFLDNSIENASGVDLVIFELSGAMPAGTPDPRENFGVSIELPTGFSPFTYFDPIATGTNSCGDPTLCLDTFAVEIDLSDFGVESGAVVDRVRLHIFDVGLGTKSADIPALGALNSGAPVPEPGTGLLLLGGLAALRMMGRVL
ncbi:MAG: hypothetical protein ACQGVC_05800 [Myxococcota bacterium]